jgi:hypothetical protein
MPPCLSLRDWYERGKSHHTGHQFPTIYLRAPVSPFHAEPLHKVVSWRELTPGVWFPTKLSHEVFNKEDFAREGKVNMANLEEQTIEKCSLEPNYAIDLFRNIPIPNGIPVYEVKDGKIIRSHVQGGVVPPPAAQGRSSWKLGLLALSLVTGLGLLVAWTRTKSTRSRVSEKTHSHAS